MATVTLNGPHTHRGTPKLRGDKIEVTEGERGWLERHGLIQAGRGRAQQDEQAEEK